MQYTKKINEGLVDNDRHFGMIYSLDDENEIDNPGDVGKSKSFNSVFTSTYGRFT